jgi:hypothetical protein
MRSGDRPGLQNRRAAGHPVTGGFDPHSLPPLFTCLGELQSVYFLDREPDKVWRYYSIARTGSKANGLIAGNESSSVNRAVAFYRSLVGIPVTQEPPAAR